jgi:hypothetical protein
MGHRNSYREKAFRWPEKKRLFLEALRECGNITHSATVAGMTRTTAYRLRARDEKFAASRTRARLPWGAMAIYRKMATTPS